MHVGIALEDIYIGRLGFDSFSVRKVLVQSAGRPAHIHRGRRSGDVADLWYRGKFQEQEAQKVW
jgi:hypothetical protein